LAGKLTLAALLSAALPLLGAIAQDEEGRPMCWDCRCQWVDRREPGSNERGLRWIQRSWIGLDGQKHGGYPDPRKKQRGLFE
jgi:hypothetical protein